jgi:hypothetical protein
VTGRDGDLDQLTGERAVEGHRALGGHQTLEPGESGVGHAATVAERLDQIVLDLTEGTGAP